MKAHIITELLPSDRSFMTYFQESNEYGFMWHFHHNYELFIQARGGGRLIVGDYTSEFSEGDIILVGPDLPHVFYTVENSQYPDAFSFYKIHFEESFIDNLTDAFSETSNLRSLFEDAKSGIRFRGKECKEIIKRADILNRNNSKSGTKSFIMFLEILEQLNNLKDRKILTGSKYRRVRSGYNTAQLDRIFEYLHLHYTEHVELKNVAQFAGASISNLCAFFKKSTGMTIIHYVNSLRISHACKLLSSSNDSIMNIALSSGYNTLSNFNRKFKEFRNSSPRDYRKSQAGNADCVML